MALSIATESGLLWCGAPEAAAPRTRIPVVVVDPGLFSQFPVFVAHFAQFTCCCTVLGPIRICAVHKTDSRKGATLSNKSTHKYVGKFLSSPTFYRFNVFGCID
jgi:hypothetical protein